MASTPPPHINDSFGRHTGARLVISGLPPLALAYLPAVVRAPKSGASVAAAALSFDTSEIYDEDRRHIASIARLISLLALQPHSVGTILFICLGVGTRRTVFLLSPSRRDRFANVAKNAIVVHLLCGVAVGRLVSGPRSRELHGDGANVQKCNCETVPFQIGLLLFLPPSKDEAANSFYRSNPFVLPPPPPRP